MKIQQGVLAVGWLGLILITCVLVVFGSRFLPVYYTNFRVKHAISVLESSKEIRAAVDNAQAVLLIKNTLLRLLAIKDIGTVRPNNIVINRVGRNYLVRVKYNTFIKLLGNVEVVVRFDNNLVIRHT